MPIPFDFMILQYSINIVDCFFLAWTAYSLYNKKLEVRVILYCFISALLLFSGNIIVNRIDSLYQFTVFIATVLLQSVLIRIILKIRIYDGLMPTSLYYLVNNTYGAISLATLSLLNIEISSFYQSIFGIIIISIPMYLCYYLLILLLKRYNMQNILRQLNKKQYLAAVTYIIVLTSILMINMVFIFNIGGSFNLVIAIILMFLYITFLLLGILLPYLYYKTVIKNKELQQQSLFCNMISGVLNDLSCFKHSYDNTLACIHGYIENGKIDELRDYLQSKTTKQISMNMTSAEMLRRIHNAGLAGLLYSKYSAIQDKGLNAHIIVDSDVDVDNNDSLFNSLGIIIDNAIEAAVESIEKYMKLYIAKNDNEIIFIVVNTANNIPELSKIYEKGWSTKGTDRGLGMWILKKNLINNKNMLYNISIEGNIVKQELHLINQL